LVRLPPIGYRWRKFGEEKGLFMGPRTSGRKHGRLGREGKGEGQKGEECGA